MLPVKIHFEIQWTLVIVNAWLVNNLSLVNISGETGRLFYNINYMLNSKHLSLVNKIGDKTEFTITRVHCIWFESHSESRTVTRLLAKRKYDVSSIKSKMQKWIKTWWTFWFTSRLERIGYFLAKFWRNSSENTTSRQCQISRRRD